MKIAVMGTGLIGQAWAIVFARAGLPVKLWDGNNEALQNATAIIAKQLQELQTQGLVNHAADALSNIKIASTLEQALEGVDYVQENLPEDAAIKRTFYALIDTMAAPETILASSTSSIPASVFTESLAGRHRCLVAHPVNPPYLVPVVELCVSPWTSPNVLERTKSLMNLVNQKPITVNREVEGFVLNRLQGALLREAFRLVENGVVSVQDLDTTVKDGLGLRWSFMGPFETIDLNAPNGLKDYCERYGPMYQSIAAEQSHTEPWSDDLINEAEKQRRQQLPHNQLLNRRLWRDERLMALIKHKLEHEESNK
ncbi:3-hydroxyacyl-CoA dehydrogenase [Orrella daihaiensis]|uniref:3-hydroxyacyl-CoA dehydrogenase n=1 Tax=Orrella daihaiensis TaxID=2782176 RepID=A0ABY4AGW6_9BURK|nr:3-hydroxyacyl-CoA dehydrogenase [Orrella daihaiensis]UOD49530.1 3-hydroxyacyl-CoA dehydrogenase [Orrella daihaiensis]